VFAAAGGYTLLPPFRRCFVSRFIDGLSIIVVMQPTFLFGLRSWMASVICSEEPFDKVTLEDINFYLWLIVVTFLSHGLWNIDIICIYFQS
jgi:hypothetical protein